MEQLNQNNVFRHPLISILFTLLVIFFVGFQIIGGVRIIWLAFFPGDAMEYCMLLRTQRKVSTQNSGPACSSLQGVGAFLGMVVSPIHFLC